MNFSQSEIYSARLQTGGILKRSSPGFSSQSFRKSQIEAARSIAIFKKRFHDADSKNTDVFVHASILFKICQDLLDLHTQNDNRTKDKSFPKMRGHEPRMQSGADDVRVFFNQ